jgi:hypothetical protein
MLDKDSKVDLNMLMTLSGFVIFPLGSFSFAELGA